MQSRFSLRLPAPLDPEDLSTLIAITRATKPCHAAYCLTLGGAWRPRRRRRVRVCCLLATGPGCRIVTGSCRIVTGSCRGVRRLGRQRDDDDRVLKEPSFSFRALPPLSRPPPRPIPATAVAIRIVGSRGGRRPPFLLLERDARPYPRRTPRRGSFTECATHGERDGQDGE